MTTRRREIETQLVTVQNEFLSNPSASLSAEQTRRRAHIDAGACQALLDVLCEAGVIARSAAGTYARYFPPLRQRFGADRLTSPGLHDMPFGTTAA